jgi:hypothetical protein
MAAFKGGSLMSELLTKCGYKMNVGTMSISLGRCHIRRQIIETTSALGLSKRLRSTLVSTRSTPGELEAIKALKRKGLDKRGLKKATVDC